MNKKEIAEIKNQFSEKNCSFERIVTCYVNSDKEIVLCETTPFLSLPEEEVFKYLEIFRKSLSGKKGKNLYDIEFSTTDGGSKEENFLNALRKSKLKDKELLDKFYKKIMDSYLAQENYLIVLAYGVYDIPGKSQNDETVFDASDEVYEHLICCICPVSLSKPGLSVNPQKGCIEDRVRDWVVGLPADSFLYPAFCDRCTDIHSMLYYSKKPQSNQVELLKELTGKEKAPLSEAEEQNLVSEALYDSTDGAINYEIVQSLCQDILARTEDGNIETCASAKELGEMLEKAGLDSRQTERFVQVCEKKVPKMNLENLVSGKRTIIQAQDTVIKLDAEHAYDISFKVIDGRICLVLPLYNNYLEVNGFAARAIRPEATESEE